MTAWRIGRIAGIDLRMHWTFLLLVGWIGLMHAISGEGTAAALFGTGLVMAVFGCVVLHELGHALAARSYGIQTRDITLLPIGGLARLDRLPRDPKQELWVAVAGPLVNVVIAGVLFGVLLVLYQFQPFVPETLVTRTVPGFLANLMWLNVMLVLFNLLPAFPMDGGRVLRALLGFVLSYQRATEIAAAVGQGMAILFAVAGLFFNPWLLLIALFIFVAAGAEASSVRFHEVMRGVPVSEAMMTEFHTLAPEDSLHHAADVLLAGAQQDFPVIDHNRVAGVLRRRDLIQAVCADNRKQLVGQAMEPVTDSVGEWDSINDAIQLMHRLNTPCLPVVRDGSVVGLLTLENVGELVMLRCARKSSAKEATQIVERHAA